MDEISKKLVKFSENTQYVFVHVRKGHKNLKTEYARAKHANTLLKELNLLLYNNNEQLLSKSEIIYVQTDWNEIKTKAELCLRRLKFSPKFNSDFFKQNQLKIIDISELQPETADDVEI